MSLPNSEQLLVDERDGVLALTLHRPQARNAMTLEMVSGLGEALAHAEASETLRVVVVRGAGGHFSAGGDLKDFARARSQPRDARSDPVAEVSAAFGRMCLAFARVSLPTVCVVEGSVLGGGFGLACAADVCLAAQSARFGLPETSLGLIPAQIAPFLVERLGFARAKRVALCGGKLDAAQALQLGLVILLGVGLVVALFFVVLSALVLLWIPIVIAGILFAMFSSAGRSYWRRIQGWWRGGR